MREKLQQVFETADWSDKTGSPRSGSGSTLEFTARLRAALPDLWRRYQVRTFLDAPCGDWTWMPSVDLEGIVYIGGDVSEGLIAENTARYAAKNRRFMHLDITEDRLPKADMMMVRDCLFHLKYWLRWAFFKNFARSEIPYLLMTMHHQPENKRLARNGGFKRFNPRVSPFFFEEPLEMIHETVDSLPEDLTNYPNLLSVRSLGLWSHAQVCRAVEAHAARMAVPGSDG
jgi:hypothetical protein